MQDSKGGSGMEAKVCLFVNLERKTSFLYEIIDVILKIVKGEYL